MSKAQDNFPINWSDADLQALAESGDIARQELVRRGIQSATKYRIRDLVGWQDYEQKLNQAKDSLDNLNLKIVMLEHGLQETIQKRDQYKNELDQQRHHMEHLLKNQDIVVWMTATLTSLTYVSLFSMIIGRTKPTVRLLEQLQPQIDDMPIEKFIEDFPSEDVEAHNQLRRNYQLVKDLVADFIDEKTPDFNTLRDLFVEGIDNPESRENITSMLRELRDLAAASRPGPGALSDTEIAKQFVQQAKEELQIGKMRRGDIDRIRKRAKILLLRERNVDDETQLDTTYQLAYRHLKEKDKSAISRWAS